METTKKWIAILTVIAICLSGVSVFCLVKIHFLWEDVKLLKGQNSGLEKDVADLSGHLSSLRYEMEESIQEAASLFEAVEYNLAGPGKETGTVACAFRIVPKLVSDDMQLELTIGDATHSLIKDGNGFTGTVEIKMFEEAVPVVAVKTDAGTQMQALEDVDLYWACRSWLPELFLSMNGISSTAEDWTQVDLAYGFHYNTEQTGAPVTFTKLTEIKTVNGQEVSNRDVTNQLRDGGEPDFYEYYTGYIVEGEETVVLTIRAEDSLGYIHELETYIEPSVEPDGSPEIATGFESIYTPDGELLYRE